jgi:hypothetical protein
VEFVRILPETNPPTLSNIFAENDSKDDVVSKVNIPFYSPMTSHYHLPQIASTTIKTVTKVWSIILFRLSIRVSRVNFLTDHDVM